MTKASSSLQDLRRGIYVKAKAEKSWRCWGLFVHVCKLETLSEAELTELRKTRLGFVFQFFNLLSTLTVRENIALPLELANRPGDRKQRDARVNELLAQVGPTLVHHHSSREASLRVSLILWRLA